MTLGGPTVTILRTATPEGTFRVAGGATKIFTTAAIRAGSSAGRGWGFGRRHGGASATRETPGSTISGTGSAEAILTAASTLVGRTIRVADGTTVGWATGAIC